MFFRTIVAFDRVRLQMEITSVVFTDEAEGDSLKHAVKVTHTLP